MIQDEDIRYTVAKHYNVTHIQSKQLLFHTCMHTVWQSYMRSLVLCSDKFNVRGF